MGDGRRHLHEYGLALTAAKSRPKIIDPNDKWPNHAASRRFFELALNVTEAPEGVYDGHSLRLHKARVRRDVGFSFVREALDSPDDARLALLQQAWIATEDSVRVTDELMPKHETALAQYTPEAEDYLFSEHGATISCLGRIAVVAEVLDIDNSRRPSELFEEAQAYLAKGSNRYYETSNAMNAARWAAINSENRERGMWVVRAQIAVSRAEIEDHGNFAPAAATYEERLRSLEKPAAARASVLERP